MEDVMPLIRGFETLEITWFGFLKVICGYIQGVSVYQRNINDFLGINVG